MKKFVALLTAMMMIIALAVPAMAEPDDPTDSFEYPAIVSPDDYANEGVVKLHKYLVLDENATVPPITFTYTIAPKAKTTTVDGVDYVVEPDDATLPVYPGVTGAVVTVGNDTTKVEFTNADTTTDGLPTDDDPTNPTEGYKYATKDIELDFSACAFDKPGVYRYTLTEVKPATADAFLYDTFAEGADNAHTTAYKRTIDVYVEDVTVEAQEAKPAVTEAWIYNGVEYENEELAQAAADTAGDTNPDIQHREPQDAQPAQEAVGPKLAVTAYVCYEGDIATAVDQNFGEEGTQGEYVIGDPDGVGATDKTDNYVNEYLTYDLQVTKTIAGNQGDKEDTFFVTILIEDIPENTKVTWFKALEYTTAIDPTDTDTYAETGEWTATDENKIEQTVEVTHLDKYLVTGIPLGATYTVNELDEEAGNKLDADGKTVDGYTVTYVGNGVDDDNTDGNGPETIEVDDDAVVENDGLYTVDITNTREGVIPTGVAIGIISGIVIVGVAAAYFILRRKMFAR